ncbi:testis-expressed protein 10 homolog [Athalia rosae]|uniref:testis-expressed protein 10 homolog n=1 Tax=Athalia rosae TaxID=37344 RepID=UPI002034907E|nr:testis-expressed protein 10 homolog [Athalia rosae]
MGKGHRHKKNLKSEKAKVKLKTKTKQLPKGLNVTDTSFKVKKILLREQLKTQNEDELVSRRNLNIKELMTRLQHYNSTVRQEAVRGLKEILCQHSEKILSSQLHSLLRSISALSLDKEKSVRRDSLKILKLILKPVSNDELEPFFDILISYLSCAMTHIDPNIKEDSLSFLDVLAENCGALLARNSPKVLPNFLDMISKLQTDSKLERTLTISLSSKQTSIKWRINVLSRLGTILTSIVNVKRHQKPNDNDFSSASNIIEVTEHTLHIPLFRKNYLKNCQFNYTKAQELNPRTSNCSDLEELQEFIKVLMPLMIESWLEVAPKQNKVAQSNLVITTEGSTLLSTIMKIMELLIEYIDIVESQWDVHTISLWFVANFRSMVDKNIIENFPYCLTKPVAHLKKRQVDFMDLPNTKCLEQNIAICHVYIWLSSFTDVHVPFSRDVSLRILQYLNERIEDWASKDNSALPHLTRCLKCLLLRASKVWYHNKVDLGTTLQALINAVSIHSKKELRSQMFSILTKIVMDHDLTELHSEPAFKEFIVSLPNLLLARSIQENSIKMLIRVVLQHRGWVEDILREKHEEIIQNAKRIDIIGSEDENRSRLSICNLFYFMDGQVYY